MNKLKQNIKLLFRINKQGLASAAILISVLLLFSGFLSLKSTFILFPSIKYFLFCMCSGFIIGLGIGNKSQAFSFLTGMGNTRLDYFKSICVFNTICVFIFSIVFSLCSFIIDSFSGVFNPTDFSLLLAEIIIFYIFLFGLSTFIIEIFYNFGKLNGISSILFISSLMLYIKRYFINTHFLYNGLIINGAGLKAFGSIAGLVFIIASMLLIKKSEVKN
jgi:hypothetical protein